MTTLLSGGSSLLGLGAGALVLIVSLVLAFLGIKKSAKNQGRAEGRLEAERENNEVVNQNNEAVAQQNAEVVRRVEEVHEIHDRLDADPAYRDSVRTRFTRPD